MKDWREFPVSATCRRRRKGGAKTCFSSFKDRAKRPKGATRVSSAMKLPAMLLVAILLAGCAETPTQEAHPNATEDAPRLALLDSTAACPRFCEPSVAVTGDGTWFVLGDSLERSADGGATFEDASLPPTPTALGAYTLFQTDSMIAAAPDGRLFYSALIASCPSACLLTGIQVASTEDGAERWSSLFLSLPSHLRAPGADRQWLAFGPDGLVCLHFQYVGPILAPAIGGVREAPEVRISCSTDGGATFPEFVSVSGPASMYVINGRGVFDDEGRLYVPYFFDGELVVAVSSDKGRTFEPRAVPGAAGDYFPALAAGPNGVLHLLWRDDGKRVSYATSTDGGATWPDPLVVSAPGETTPTSPWIESHEGSFSAAWFVAESEASNRIVLWDGESTLTLAEDLPNGDGRAAATDFAHLTLTPDARALVVFGDLDAATTRLAAVG